MSKAKKNEQIEGGKPFYGQPIGILMMDAVVPRLPGDIGNGYTFDFPVRFRVVRGATTENVVHKPSRAVLEPFIAAARELEAEGVRAITTSCGYLSWFQEELSEAVDVPVFTSSLIQAPMVHRMLRSGQKIGILTADSRTLSVDHLQACGVSPETVVLIGSQDTPAFYDTFPINGLTLDLEGARHGVVELVRRALSESPEIGAIVCEGSNFALFRQDVQETFGVPFFDIVTLTRMIHEAVVPIPRRTGIL